MTLHRVSKAWLLVGALFAVMACQRAQPLAPGNTAVTSATHSKFPISSGVHAVSCNTCHGDFASFSQFTCFNCHGHDQNLTDEMHRSLVTVGGAMGKGGSGYVYASESCLQCHATGARVAFDHAGVTSACATCHDSAAPFDALPVAGTGLDGGTFVHPDKRGNDCRACHTTATWISASGAPDGVRDPSHDYAVAPAPQIPAYAGTSIVSLTAQPENLPMPMVHTSATVPSAISCISCHVNANSGVFFPGEFHASLTAATLAQPTTCLDCHATSVPIGFVGPADPSRNPASGEMKHDAVLWSNGVPTTMPAVPQECSLCHQAPPASPTWATSQKLHASLAATAQPSSCLDCHANSRPVAPVTSTSARWQFDHSSGPALGECSTCHLSTSQYTSWTGGRFHLAGSATPSSCLPCHSGERPTTTSGWDPSYLNSPFDYVQDASGTPTHGAGQDCAVCHAGPGNGSWGSTQNWKRGHFGHGAASFAGTTCIGCHSTQRPDRNGYTPAQILDSSGQPFDHSLNGAGDCFGCHQATVAPPRGSYVTYTPIPGGDWRGGIGYPGSTLISAPTQFITVTEISLTRSGANSLVSGTSSLSATFYNAMLHTSLQVPSSMRPLGPTDWPRCAMCHAVSAANGSGSFADGQFHSKVRALGLPQPGQCLDCHAQMRPVGIVEKSASELQPMDHSAAFASGSVAAMDCASCHSQPGVVWSDGVFHAKIGSAQPQDCTVCHYPVMADVANADLTSGTSYAMKHKSGQITVQNCQACHAKVANTASPLLSAEWNPGSYHSKVAPQPAACNDCHSPVSKPGASMQSTVSYLLSASAATLSNQRQWMNHASPSVVGKDCAVCHATDAAPGVTAWSKSDLFHAAVAGPASCQECHGVTNGGGAVAVAGTNNNLPTGLTNSSTVTSAAADSTTGILAGTLDQISHTDINATSHDCSFCHTQKGVSNVNGVQGKEWAQASFHTSFKAGNPLVMNGTSGRCSDCHMNVKPGTGFALLDHSSFTSAPGSQDCASCHSWPGTGTSSSPNWLGASAAPDIVTLTGWSSGASITSNTVTFSHPRPGTYTSCAQCHVGSNDTTIVDYNHDGLDSNVTINGVAVSPAPNLGTSQYNVSTNPTFCVACHNSNSPWINRSGASSTITANTTSGSTTVLTTSTSALTMGMTVTGTGIPNTTTTTSTFTATITNGSTTVTTATPVSFRAGTVISGTGIPANDTVATSVNNATTFTLTAPATTSTTETLTATTTNSLTVTITSIPSSSSFVVSSPANATLTGTTLTVTHMSIRQVSIGSHGGSNNTEDCTSCHYVGGRDLLTPPTPGVFGTGSISGG